MAIFIWYERATERQRVSSLCGTLEFLGSIQTASQKPYNTLCAPRGQRNSKQRCLTQTFHIKVFLAHLVYSVMLCMHALQFGYVKVLSFSRATKLHYLRHETTAILSLLKTLKKITYVYLISACNPANITYGIILHFPLYSFLIARFMAKRKKNTKSFLKARIA